MKYSIAHSLMCICDQGNAGSVPASASLAWRGFAADFAGWGL
ncbi:hypothetical protein [Thiothrix subterranea]|uniref:Uncharacterized protein n=1 Tax=Thiothrix subterranea TaxID=2735563 RepID=A0AA51MPH5_9GAMM|nr:hypothetical protein [Thiothrix subterranea]MDQ5770020.1 hypothetical protein [Thiothrix subterranea]WML88279.1 hypothetical protein RCG00_07840 [Thiothrix subterranea]